MSYVSLISQRNELPLRSLPNFNQPHANQHNMNRQSGLKPSNRRHRAAITVVATRQEDRQRTIQTSNSG